MKTLKQLREEYDNLPQITSEDLVLEAKDKSLMGATIPSPKEMPVMLLFRRVTYRVYPNKQVVALYYSKMIDKYFSVPFGPTGNLNVNEATIYDTLEELEISEGAKWQATKGGIKGAAQGAIKGFFKGNAIAAEPGMAIGAVVGGVHGAYKGAKRAYQKAKEQDKDMNEDWSDVKHQNPSGGLKKSGVMAYRREHPGSKLQTAVTTKPSKLKPGSKASNRRKSFCARMGGMKKRLTSAKTARDPDSRINKALRKWNCEESFKSRLNQIREEKVKPWFDYSDLGGAIKTATELTPGASAYQKTKEGDYAGAAKSAAIDVALGGAAKLAGKGLGLVKKGLGKFSKNAKPATPNLGQLPSKAKPKAPAPKSARGRKLGAVADLAGAALDVAQSMKPAATQEPEHIIQTSGPKTPGSKIKSTIKPKLTAKVSENTISDIRAMIESKSLHDLKINGRTVTLNSSMAKRIVEVYDSVNTKNKKIVEGMLNEDLESFKRLLNFSIKA